MLLAYFLGLVSTEEVLDKASNSGLMTLILENVTLPMVFGMLIFYACCLQCVATLAVIRRETNSWRWPVFAWSYMTSIGYLGALLVYQLGS